MIKRMLSGLLLLLLLGACGQDEPTPGATGEMTGTPAPAALTQTGIDAAVTVDGGLETGQGDAQPTTAPLPTDAPPTPTATPTPPLAALVNERPILLADFDATLARYEQGVYFPPPEVENPDYRRLALDLLVDQELLRQAASEQGIAITAEQVGERMAEEREMAGSAENFEAWLAANQMSEAEYEAGVAEAMMTQSLMAVITVDVPFAVEQVRARAIQVDDVAQAQMILEQIRAGADFEALAQQFSLERHTGDTGGDLGFFPRNTLLVPEVEAAAFALELGQTSDIISVTRLDGTMTHYLVQVTEIEPQRPLLPEQRALLLKERFESWLESYRSQADIQIFVDIGA